MIYTTGTIAVSGNTLTGTGTNFTAAGSLIRNGCTVIALTNPAQVFQITAINSATSLTVTPAASPAIPAGTKYSILLSDSLSVDGLAQDIAETFTLYQRNMSGFADVMNGTGDVTITINGVAVTVPGQKSLAKKGANKDITSLTGLTTALSIAQGGTGGKTAAEARTNLGLGTAATKTVGTATGNVMQVGAFGVGAALENKPTDASSSFISDAAGNTLWAPANGCGFQSSYTEQRIAQLWITYGGAMFSRFLTTTDDPQTPKSSVPWAQMQSAGTSDINFKKVTGELNLEVSLANIVAMDFKTFYYLADEEKTIRRGVVAQELEKIDPQYVHSAEESGKMTLDLNPLVLDALAAIKELAIRVSALEGDAKSPASGSSAG